jgi:hypothetical protein
MLKVKLPYLNNATITNQRDCNPEYWKKCQMSNSSWKINVSILYYVPHSCDNTAYATTSLRDKKEKYSNSCVVRKKISERNKKTYPPPSPSFKLNGRSLMYLIPVTILHMLHLLLLHLSRRKIVSLMNVTFRRMPGMTMFLLIFIFAILSFSFYLV